MSVFLKACGLEKTPHTPVWLMRQAGRYMKEYREIREKKAFLEVCKDASLAAEITVSAQQTLGTDAAILFSDLLLILEPMGLKLEYGDDGPSISNPVSTTSDVDALKAVAPEQSLPFVLEAARQASARLKVPLIGFAGAPFTIASYMIEGGSSRIFSRTKDFMQADWMRWDTLMRKIADSTARYLLAQIAHGAKAVQLFDSWAGALNPEEYRRFAMPYTKSLLARVGNSVPVIHFGTNTSSFLESFADAGGSVIGVDHRIQLGEAWKRIGPGRAIQGNLEPKTLATGGVALEREVRRILEQAGGRPGHIFNLGHGVLPETPFENVRALVEMVHALSAEGQAVR